MIERGSGPGSRSEPDGRPLDALTNVTSVALVDVCQDAQRPGRQGKSGPHAPSPPARPPPPAAVGLILSDDRELTRLNRSAMAKDGPTDVLSFPLLSPSAYPPHEGPEPAGPRGPA